MNNYKCPLCADTYGEETNLHVHLEVEHRKSEIVSHLVERLDETTRESVENERRRVEDEPPIPPA